MVKDIEEDVRSGGDPTVCLAQGRDLGEWHGGPGGGQGKALLQKVVGTAPGCHGFRQTAGILGGPMLETGVGLNDLCGRMLSWNILGLLKQLK